MRTYVQFAIYNYLVKFGSFQRPFNSNNYTYKEIDNIPIYKKNVKVYGVDPSGEEEILYGDVNTDGVIDAIDLGLLKKYLLSMDEDTISIKNADLNQDGFVDAIDFAQLKKILLK